METTTDSVPSSSSRCWISSTNWIIARGCLDDSISYDCSSSLIGDPDAEDSTTIGTLLRKPTNSEFVDPCEITIRFRERHEIHRVYIRSTSRVYEIYYAFNETDSDNEYLHTVRCGAAATGIFLPDVNEGHFTVGTSLPENNKSNNDEDGWVEVNGPDSTLVNGRKESIPKYFHGSDSDVQGFYEATAEISDASPCISITLRLLSLQSKDYVYVDEIYVYADPVESEATGSVTSSCLGSNMAGSSLLAMLVPGLLQLSKNDSSLRPVRGATSSSVMTSCESSADGNTEKSSIQLEKEKLSMETCYPSRNSTAEDQQSPSKGKVSQIYCDQQVPSCGNLCSSINKDVKESNHVVDLLHELVSRVGRIESFCSQFEEKMVMPLESMETRLQRMEKQLEVLNTKIYEHETHPCSGFFVPEFSCHQSEWDTKERDSSYIINQKSNHDYPSSPVQYTASPTLVSKASHGLVVTAPEFPQDDDLLTSCSTRMHSAGKVDLENKEAVSLGPGSPCDANPCDVKNLGSTVKFFLDGTASLHGESEYSSVDDSACINDESVSTATSSLNIKAPFSIDKVLASTLEAFMFSAMSKPTTREILSNNLENSIENKLVPPIDLLDEVVECSGKETSSFIPFNYSSQHSMEDEANEKDQNHVDGAEETSSQARAYVEHESNISISSGETVSSDLVNEGLDGESDKEGYLLQTSDRSRLYKGLIDDSDTDSSVNEDTILNQRQVNWTDDSSTDSRNDNFPLRSWLASQQDQHDHADAVDHCPTPSLNNDSTVCYHEKSKHEIERALGSAWNLDDNSILNVTFSLERTSGLSIIEELLGEEPKLIGDSDVLSQHGLDSNISASVDQFLFDVEGSSSLTMQSVKGEEEMKKNPPFVDLNSPVSDEPLLVDVEEVSLISKGFAMMDENIHIPQELDQEPFLSLI